jgi:hydrogenase maturation protease
LTGGSIAGEPRALVIGVGNAYRRDDAAGLIAAQRLCGAARGTVTLRQSTGEGTALIEMWEGAEAVIVIDAVFSGGRPGTVYRLDAHAHPLPRSLFRSSTHAFTVADAIELARALNRLPARLVVFGVEGKQFSAGEGLSPEVRRAVDEIVRRGLEELGADS